MRILKVANCENTRNSGMGRVMHSTADELRAMGHEVDLWFKGEFASRSFGRLDRFFAPVSILRSVRRAARAGRIYDVVEIHEPLAAPYCYARASDPALPPCVVMSHGVEEHAWLHRLAQDRMLGKRTSLKSRVMVPLTLLPQARYALRRCDQVMCLNARDEAFLVHRLQVRPDRVTRVTNGVAEQFHSDVQRPTDGPPRLLFVGSWLDGKGTALIVRAFSGLAREIPGLRLSVLGSGYPAATVLADFPDAVRGAVEVQPRVTDDQLLTAYRDHHVVLLASFFESWGLGILEAAAAGVVPVATQAAGPCEVFTDGVDALLTPVGDSGAFEAALRRVVCDGRLRSALSEATRRTARQLTWSRAARGHLSAYQRATNSLRERCRDKPGPANPAVGSARLQS